MPDPRADDELDEYLSGCSQLSRQYRRENSPLPPPALERTLLEASDSDFPKRGPRVNSQSLAPLAFAASVFLSLAMVLAVVLGPQSRKSDEKPRIVPVRMFKSEPPRAAVISPRERNPAAWLAYIDSLHRGGRDTEAELEMRRFRSAYPDYNLPSNE